VRATRAGGADRFRIFIERVWWSSLDVVFPPRCSGCQRVGERLCSLCRAQIEYLSHNVCDRCGYPRNAPITDPCGQCRRVLFGGSGLRSLAFHEGPLRRAIHTLKYRNNAPVAEALAGLMSEHWPESMPANAVLMPVPLSAQRLRERGFNQAEVLARQLGAHRRAPVMADGLRRVKVTQSQVGLTAAQRQQNVAGAFAADPTLARGLTTILIDDVCTTGATLAACAEALLQNGAKEVWAYTLARARYDSADTLNFDGGSS